MDARIGAILRQAYDLADVQEEARLATKGQREAYRIRAGEERLVLKVTDPDRPVDVVQSDVGILDYLGKYDFPAPRPLRTRQGELFVPFENRYLYVYEYIEGEYPQPSRGMLERLGALLARLHSLPMAGFGRVSPYQPSEMLPEIRGYLDGAQPGIEGMVADMRAMVDGFPSFEGLPKGLIHTDPYLTNLLDDGNGKLYLIDWDDGGISYPLLDIGYIAHLCTYPAHEAARYQVGEGVAVGHGLIWRPDWMQAFLDAYQSVRPLTDLERKLWRDAVRISFLVYIWDWGAQRIIPENYERLKILEGFEPRWA